MKLNTKKLSIIISAIAVLAAAACTIDSDYTNTIKEKISVDLNPPAEKTYTVTYDGNGNTGGSPPVDNNEYKSGDDLIILSTETLVKTGYTHTGWNTESDGSGMNYSPGTTVEMPLFDLVLYAQWELIPTYRIYYDANGADEGTEAPVDSNSYYSDDLATVLGKGDLTLSGKTFVGWNTLSTGDGTNYIQGEKLRIYDNDVTLYAKWSTSAYELTVTAGSNGSITLPVTSPIYVDHGVGTPIEAAPDTGFTFMGWLVTSGTVLFADDDTSLISTTVTLESGDAAITAVFEDITPPEAPVLTLSGSTPTQNTTPTWTWSSGGGGNGTYQYKINDNDFDTGGYEENSNTTYTYTTPSDGTYTLYIRELDDAGNPSSISESSVTVDTVGSTTAPTVSCTSDSIDTTPYWSWTHNSADGSGNYRYKLDSSNLETGSTSTTHTFYSPSSSLSEGTHTLYVQESDAAGNWSVTGSKSITISIPPPTLLTPTSGGIAEGRSPYLDWDSVSGVTHYQIQIDASSNFSSMDVNTTVSASAYQVTVELTVGYTYYWRVRSRNSDGVYGQTWSAIWSFNPEYTVGDRGPAGGYVFYDDQDGGPTITGRYLEVAPAYTEFHGVEWGTNGTLIGGTGTAIDTGTNNTYRICNALTQNPEPEDRAAELCSDLVVGSYTDWFLPSKDEIELIYQNLHKNSLGGFSSTFYWSSSESTSTSAWMRHFGGESGSDYIDDRTKTNSFYVRAVRNF